MRSTGVEPLGSRAASTDAISKRVVSNLLPFLFVLYFANQLDRVNISFAALTMNKDIGLTAEMYGLGAGIFFLGYFLFEVPSNLVMHRVGARIWIFRIMLTWGLISAAMAWVNSPLSFYAMRFLLGLAEAGFVPGIFLYLSYWIPDRHMGRANGWFILAAPLTTVVAGPLSVALLQLDGALGFRGWQWMFLVEGLPTVLLAFVSLWALPDRPERARWLTAAEKTALTEEIAAENHVSAGSTPQSAGHGFTSPTVVLLSVIYLAMVIGLYGIAFWLPQIVKGMGFSNLQTGFVIAVPYLLGTVACIVWCRRSDRALERRWHFALPSFLAAAGLAASAALGPQWPALATIALAVIGIWAALPVFWCVPARHLSGVAAAVGMAVINSVGNLGGFAGPYLVGWLREATGGFSTALMVLAAGPLVAGLLALCLPSSAPKPVVGVQPAH